MRNYEYKDLVAETWDVLRGDTSKWPDRLFYRNLIHQYGEPVLDIGCGTGRLLLDYKQQGTDIDGLDNSPEMLEICKKKGEELGLAPKLFEGHMETMDLPRKYNTILVPSSSLQLIIEPDLVENALRQAVLHLLPGGIIAASIMTLWKSGEPLNSEWEKSAVRNSDGVEFRKISKARFDPKTECEHTEDKYQMVIDNEIVKEEIHSRSPATRSYTQDQAKAIFKKAGFSNVELFSEFTNNPVKPDDDLFVIIGEKL